MTRRPRIKCKDLAYRVSSKGNVSREIFKEDQDKSYLINLLKQKRTKSKLTFYGHIPLPDLDACLMETCKNNLTPTVRRTNSGYAYFLNRRYQYKNKLFHDSYNGFIMEKEIPLIEKNKQVPPSLACESRDDKIAYLL